MRAKLLCAAWGGLLTLAMLPFAAFGGMGAKGSFSQLDANNDGVISKQEAGNLQRLSDNWDRADRNQDQVVDTAEFNAFEESRGSETQPDDSWWQPAGPITDQEWPSTRDRDIPTGEQP